LLALPPSTVASVLSPPLLIDVPMKSVATGDGVAIPFFTAERANQRIRIRIVRRERHKVGQHVPPRRGPIQAVEQRRLLGRTLDGARWVECARAVAVHTLRHRAAGRGRRVA
jgi:hypothetical protein